MDYSEQLNRVLNAVWAIGGQANKLVVRGVASQDEVAQAERELGVRFPDEFRQALLHISSHLSFNWFLPDNFKLPTELREIFCGELHWGLDLLGGYQESKAEWLADTFADTSDPYNKVWHEKLAFQAVGNGDYIALDLSDVGYGRVVYLSHDDGEGHGYVLGQNFTNFLERWIPLGCPGGEDWQWLPFVASKDTGIDPECPNAKTWKQILFGGNE